MIPANRAPAQPVRWQQLWRDAVSDPYELLGLLDLSEHATGLLPHTDTGFALRVPHGFIARMRRGDPADPLLLHIAEEDQFVPKEAQALILASLKNHPQVEIYSYPGRNHAFARVGGEHYDAGDAAKANARTLALFKKALA